MMSATRLIVPYGGNGLHARSCHRFSGSASIPWPTRLSAVSGRHFLGNQDLKAFSTVGRVASDRNTKMDTTVYCSTQPGASLPSGPPTNSWEIFGRKNWIIGMLLSMVVPLWRFKLGPLLQLKNEVETAMNTTEQIAETIESVAEKVEQVADDIGNHLPEGGKLRQVADFVENVAKETAKGAHLVDAAIEKAEDIEKKVDSLVEEVEQVADDVEEVVGKEAAEQK
ncbi:uncharacterized protein LOC117906040 isoform X1 [Vitis riparia]|uniref:uncharacterized protein LOC117906040 isoform X1 n=1 Tax=Vitis riparia TaxID=96939 RepID=UPI00155A36F9|nr:uncharacterized protein LOC117906040 isoform X1 [Vitis riparia]